MFHKVLACATLFSLNVQAQPGSIRRLDGSKITIREADAFARRTLEAAQVTGAQIVVLDKGRVVWSQAFGLRRKEPELPMDRETTTWADSITKGVLQRM